MKTERMLWLLLGIILVGIVIGIIHDYRDRDPEAPIHSGNLSFDYHWLPDDSSQAVTIVKLKPGAPVGDKLWCEYEITAKNEAFTVRLSVRGREVESARILDANFHGQTQVNVWRDRMVTVPQTPGLTTTYEPQADFRAPKEKWVEAEILIGAHFLPPYSPMIAAGIGIRRLPLVGKLPPLMIGAGWFGTAPGAFIQYRF